MNRQRKTDESYESYRASQNAEQTRIKEHLRGKFVHVSKQYTAEGRPTRGNTRVGSFKNAQ